MKKEWIIIPLILVVASFLGGTYYGQRRVLAGAETRCDTITKIVSVYKDFPQPQKTASVGFVSVPAYKFLTDTVKSVEWAEIAVHDTTVVYLPMEQKYYEEEDGKLRLWVSGYDPRLDRYELDKETVVITNKTTLKPSRFSLGVQAGMGALYMDKKFAFTPYFGVGVTYSLIYF